jgi:NAD(P)-dependent dehydrogenase (short-subunit alcohol dehydrogenase family)
VSCHFAEVSPERLHKIMEVNFFGMTEMIRVFLPILKQGRKPAIVNISSIAGKRGIPARSEYSASKFAVAVQGFSEALRAELAKDGIDVLVICPGLTQTNFSQNMLEQKAKMPMDHMRGMTADKVAEVIIRSIESGRNEICLTGQGKLIVFMTRFFPRWSDRIAARRVRALFKDEIAARKHRSRWRAGCVNTPVEMQRIRFSPRIEAPLANPNNGLTARFLLATSGGGQALESPPRLVNVHKGKERIVLVSSGAKPCLQGRPHGAAAPPTSSEPADCAKTPALHCAIVAPKDAARGSRRIPPHDASRASVART